MGEPINHYSLQWALIHLTLRDPERKESLQFTIDTLPQPLQKAARGLGLYIDAYAHGKGASAASPWFKIRLNTGVASRAGEVSYNTPGSTDWNKTFVSNLNAACKAGNAISPINYMDAKSAKHMFKYGVTLHTGGFELCPESGFSDIDSLENAIAKMCSQPDADKQYRFCPKQEKKEDEKDKPVSGLGASILDGDSRQSSPQSVSGMLDDDAEIPAIRKRLSAEIEKYRPQAEQVCRQKKQVVDACYLQNNCNKPSDSPSEAECKSIPWRPSEPVLVLTSHSIGQPGDTCYREDAECRAARKRWALAEEEKNAEMLQSQRDWDSKYAALRSQCKKMPPLRSAYSQCMTQYAASCNPEKFTSVDECVETQIRLYGPKESDAKKLHRTEREQRVKSGSSGLKNILD